MPARPDLLPASVHARAEGDAFVVSLRGRWRLSDQRPVFSDIPGIPSSGVLWLEMDQVDAWDSSLLLFLRSAQQWAGARGIRCELSRLPAEVRLMLGKLERPSLATQEADGQGRRGLFTTVGLATHETVTEFRSMSTFVGECVLSAVRLARQPHRFRWKDCLSEMQQCGVMALPIVSLISLLVGLIMAYQAAVQLRQFGADIYVADLVGLAVVREMGPMMAAVIMAGRTGAAFAATIANMKAGEEIDALETLGIVPIDFLVMPRLVALGIMMPLLAMYANLLGIVGGILVSASVLDIPPNAYWVETLTIVDLSDFMTGIIKAVVFGLLIGLSGCLRGFQSARSAAGVGRATTSAVVTAILIVIVADALFAVVFNILGW